MQERPRACLFWRNTEIQDLAQSLQAMQPLSTSPEHPSVLHTKIQLFCTQKAATVSTQCPQTGNWAAPSASS